MFCKHNWKILSEHTTESKFELAKRTGVVISKARDSYVLDLLERQFIQIATCNKCGKIKRWTTNV